MVFASEDRRVDAAAVNGDGIAGLKSCPCDPCDGGSNARSFGRRDRHAPNNDGPLAMASALATCRSQV